MPMGEDRLFIKIVEEIKHWYDVVDIEIAQNRILLRKADFNS